MTASTRQTAAGRLTFTPQLVTTHRPPNPIYKFVFHRNRRRINDAEAQGAPGRKVAVLSAGLRHGRFEFGGDGADGLSNATHLRFLQPYSTQTSAAASAVPDVAPATPNGDEVWLDAETGGVVELSPFDVKALDEDMKKLYHKQLNYQHTCQVRQIENLDTPSQLPSQDNLSTHCQQTISSHLLYHTRYQSP